MNDEEYKPWDTKTLILSLGEEDDAQGFIKFEVFDDDWFMMCEGGSRKKNPKWCYESIHIDAAVRLRDFLIYATKGLEIKK
jgi:hypothetical protein